MPFAKGNRANPNGGPRKKQCLTHLLRRSLSGLGPDGKPRKAALAKKVADLALQGKPWAVQLVWERIDGKVPQALEHSGPEGGSIPISITEGDAKRLVDAVEKLADGDKS